MSFMPPRLSTSGKWILSAESLIQRQGSSFWGLLSLNIKVDVVSNAVNQQHLKKTGYFFIIDQSPLSTGIDVGVIIHPSISASASRCAVPLTLRCIDQRFLDSDHTKLASMLTTMITGGVVVSGSFVAADQNYVVSYAPILYMNIAYGMVSLCPQNEITVVGDDVQATVNGTVQTSMGIIIAVVTLATFLVALLMISVARRIMSSIMLLEGVCNDLITGNLGVSVDTLDNNTSVEVKMLMFAFSGMIISLRFASESFVKGDLQKAQAVFTEALQLFTDLKNPRGISTAQNNLGVVYLKTNQIESADSFLSAAVVSARERVTALPPGASDAVANKTRRVLSDRLGNLALVRTRQKQPEQALAFLEEGVAIDRAVGNTTGVFVKVGNLSQILVELERWDEAISSLRALVPLLDVFTDAPMPEETRGIIEQHLFANQAFVLRAMGLFPEAQACCVHSLTCSRFVDRTCAAAVFSELYRTSVEMHQTTFLELHVTPLMKTLGIQQNRKSSSSSGKHVFLLLDQSGSMSGGRIKSSVQSMANLFGACFLLVSFGGICNSFARSDKHISVTDSLMVLTFSGSTTIERIAFQPKPSDAVCAGNMRQLSG